MSNVNSTVNEVAPEVAGHRKSEYPVNPQFLNRWSSRALSDRKVTEQDLFTVLEAGHWAPSSYNDQPWRFIYAHTEEQLTVFHQFINEFNNTWAANAPVLILLASDKRRPNGDLNGAHSFDAGTAWGSIALQANLLGLTTRAMGGFDHDKARRLLNVPDSFELHVVIALGYPGDKDQLPPNLRDMDVPTSRRPLKEVIFKGTMKP
ncbi:nitroreductase family protein [Paenibacillus xerothermodurans]|uniref:Nitroreductase n=1 Tax=Paenibacillus xerothermodurans TaxID=1977292 RepID=A0A2W1NH90_PAEXE|nr:nitroreductase family protein [Paenibacillus xerothermodurans]PZE22501.1 nitroreductase [Paenibacillus xerothermodurans]